MSRRGLLNCAGLLVAACILAPPLALAQSAADVVKRAAEAMGADSIRTLRYAAEGIGYTHGQAFRPGKAWPKITVHSQIRSIDYENGAMREEIVLSRAEPRGGGGYPLAGQQRNDQFVSGGHAWNMAGQTPQPGARFVADRVHQLWLTPHGVIKAAQRNAATVAWRRGGTTARATLAFTEPGRFTAKVFLDERFLVDRIESRAPDPVLGEVAVVTRFSDYRDIGGTRFPGRIRQSTAGFPVLDVTVKDVQPNPAVAIAVPEAVRTAAERVVSEKVADGVWFVAGGSHNSVAIEMKDHLVLVEAPLGDGRTLSVIEHVRQLVPGKPIRYVVNSHQHFDHSGGLRAAAAEGITIVAQKAVAGYMAQRFRTQNRIAPDRLAQSGRKPRFLAVSGRHVMTDGARRIEIREIAHSVHSGAFLMVHLPKEKLLIEADAYTPLPPNAPPPTPPNANNVNLIANIEGGKLAVERILPLHGRIVPVSELYATAGMTPRR